MSPEVAGWVAQYRTLQARIKELQALQKPINEALSAEIDASGFADDKSHMWLNLEAPISGIKSLQHQRKVQIGLDLDAAIVLLKEKGLDQRCIMLVPALDDDAVAAARFEDLLTDEDLDVIFPKKITWALVFQKE